jgi:hypothetical protein
MPVVGVRQTRQKHDIMENQLKAKDNNSRTFVGSEMNTNKKGELFTVTANFAKESNSALY